MIEKKIEKFGGYDKLESMFEEYKNENISFKNLCKKYDIANDTLKKYFEYCGFNYKNPDLVKQKKENALKNLKVSMKKKYGYENNSQRPEVREKMRSNSFLYGSKEFKENMMKKHGVEYPMQSKDIKDKSKKSCLERFGVEWAFQSEEVQKKSRETNIKKYGVENCQQSAEVQSKKRSTCLKKYGVDSYSKTDYFKKTIARNENYKILYNKDLLLEFILSFSDKPSLYILSQELDYEINYVGLAINKFGLQDYIEYKRPIRNQYWCDLLLNKFNVKCNLEGSVFTLNKKKCDIICSNVAIDINPTATHNTQYNPFGSKHMSKVDRFYHQNRAIDAEKNGYYFYQIFDWDDEDKVLLQLSKILGVCDKVDILSCSIEKIDASLEKKFLDKYDNEGYVESLVSYGIFYEDELIGVMSFGKSLDTLFSYELLRHCTAIDITNGTEKLLKMFVNDYNPSNIIAKVDYAKDNGTILESIGFEFSGLSEPVVRYAPIKCTGEVHQKEDIEKNDEDYYKEKKWYSIYDAGLKFYTWKGGD